MTGKKKVGTMGHGAIPYGSWGAIWVHNGGLCGHSGAYGGTMGASGAYGGKGEGGTRNLDSPRIYGHPWGVPS